jgi:hypothetical protein
MIKIYKMEANQKNNDDSMPEGECKFVSLFNDKQCAIKVAMGRKFCDKHCNSLQARQHNRPSTTPEHYSTETINGRVYLLKDGKVMSALTALTIRDLEILEESKTEIDGAVLKYLIKLDAVSRPKHEESSDDEDDESY